MIEPKAHLKAIHRTPEEAESRLGYLRMEKNERIVPFHDKIIARFRQLLTPDMILAYPELEPLFQKISQHIKVDRDHLYLAAGSDLGIKTVYETYIAPGDRIVLHKPTYTMEEIYGRIFQAQIVSVPFGKDLKMDEQAYLEAITPGTRMVVLESPGGFIGSALSYDFILRVVQKAHRVNALALIDEAYYLFSQQNIQPLYQQYDNVIISRTFSKDLGLAGLRCAYLLSQKANIEAMYHVKPMHEISSASVAFALASLEFPEFIQAYVQDVKSGIQFLKSELGKKGIATAGGDANFVLIYIGDTINLDTLVEDLKSERILARKITGFEPLKGWIRVNVGTLDQLRQFIKALDISLKKLGWRPEAYQPPSGIARLDVFHTTEVKR